MVDGVRVTRAQQAATFKSRADSFVKKEPVNRGSKVADALKTAMNDLDAKTKGAADAAKEFRAQTAEAKEESKTVSSEKPAEKSAPKEKKSKKLSIDELVDILAVQRERLALFANRLHKPLDEVVNTVGFDGIVGWESLSNVLIKGPQTQKDADSFVGLVSEFCKILEAELSGSSSLLPDSYYEIAPVVVHRPWSDTLWYLVLYPLFTVLVLYAFEHYIWTPAFHHIFPSYYDSWFYNYWRVFDNWYGVYSSWFLNVEHKILDYVYDAKILVSDFLWLNVDRRRFYTDFRFLEFGGLNCVLLSFPAFGFSFGLLRGNIRYVWFSYKLQFREQLVKVCHCFTYEETGVDVRRYIRADRRNISFRAARGLDRMYPKKIKHVCRVDYWGDLAFAKLLGFQFVIRTAADPFYQKLIDRFMSVIGVTVFSRSNRWQDFSQVRHAIPHVAPFLWFVLPNGDSSFGAMPLAPTDVRECLVSTVPNIDSLLCDVSYHNWMVSHPRFLNPKYNFQDVDRFLTESFNTNGSIMGTPDHRESFGFFQATRILCMISYLSLKQRLSAVENLTQDWGF
jgi:hypothetical protein